MPKERSVVVTLFSLAIILGALTKIAIIIDFPHYVYLHQGLDQNLILFRYAVSWIERILMLAAGIGIWYLKDIFRKLAIVLWAVIICTISIKHPYDAFLRHILYLDKMGLIDLRFILNLGWSVPAFARIVMTVIRLWDLAFGLGLIYFFTRPAVKRQFD